MKEFKEPSKSHVAHLGKMDAIISEAGSKWSEGAIRINFRSESDWLLRPETTEIDKEPSAADKMLAIIKRGLIEEGMHVIDDKAPDMGVGYGQSRFKQQQTQAFHSFMPGDDGVVVRATRGEYQSKGGEFNAAIIASEANEIVDRMAHLMKDTHGAKDTADTIGRIYHLMEERRKPVKELLPEIPIAVETQHEELQNAVKDRLPPKYFANDKERSAAATEIANGIIGGYGEAAWQHTKDENLHARDEDPLRGPVENVLKKHANPATGEALVRFMASEACEAAYSILTGRHADYPNR